MTHAQMRTIAAVEELLDDLQARQRKLTDGLCDNPLDGELRAIQKMAYQRRFISQRFLLLHFN